MGTEWYFSQVMDIACRKTRNKVEKSCFIRIGLPLQSFDVVSARS